MTDGFATIARQKTAGEGMGGSSMESLAGDDPRQVAGYQIRSRLGAGGMGRVYLAFTAGGRPVALKVIRPELGDNAEFRNRFRQEVDAARRVNGLYTAQVLDADPDATPPWLVTAYVAGPSLQQAVDSRGPLPLETTLLLMAGVAEALQAVHAAGLVHRDLKPSNVLLASDGPRVIDFGIARATEATTVTRTGLRIGSPPYMAPEQILGLSVTPATDVFALGSVIAFAALGRLPFGTGDDQVMLYRVVHQQPDLTGCPPALRPLLERCLAKNAAERLSPGEIIAACRELSAGQTLQVAQSWLPAGLSADLADHALPSQPSPTLNSGWPAAGGVPFPAAGPAGGAFAQTQTSAAPGGITPPAAFQQPAAFQPPGAYQQPAAFQQPGAVPPGAPTPVWQGGTWQGGQQPPWQGGTPPTGPRRFPTWTLVAAVAAVVVIGAGTGVGVSLSSSSSGHSVAERVSTPSPGGTAAASPAVAQRASASAPATPTAAGQSAKAPVHKASPTPTGAACLVGTWRVVNRQVLSQINSQEITFTATSGEMATYRANGTATDTFSDQTYHATINGEPWTQVLTGGSDSHWSVDGGQILYSNISSHGTDTLYENGAYNNSGPLNESPGANPYSCTATTLNESFPSGGSVELKRVSG